MENIIWSENLPESCPPKDAVPCNGKFYRLVNSKDISNEDFLSQRALNPNKHFPGVDECLVRSLSVFQNLETIKNKLRIPKFKNCYIYKITLTPDNGVIKKTFGPYHYSWWRTKNLDFNFELI